MKFSSLKVKRTLKSSELPGKQQLAIPVALANSAMSFPNTSRAVAFTLSLIETNRAESTAKMWRSRW
jgi:hypothetical protein